MIVYHKTINAIQELKDTDLDLQENITNKDELNKVRKSVIDPKLTKILEYDNFIPKKDTDIKLLKSLFYNNYMMMHQFLECRFSLSMIRIIYNNRNYPDIMKVFMFSSDRFVRAWLNSNSDGKKLLYKYHDEIPNTLKIDIIVERFNSVGKDWSYYCKEYKDTTFFSMIDPISRILQKCPSIDILSYDTYQIKAMVKYCKTAQCFELMDPSFDLDAIRWICDAILIYNIDSAKVPLLYKKYAEKSIDVFANYMKVKNILDKPGTGIAKSTRIGNMMNSKILQTIFSHSNRNDIITDITENVIKPHIKSPTTISGRFSLAKEELKEKYPFMQKAIQQVESIIEELDTIMDQMLDHAAEVAREINEKRKQEKIEITKNEMLPISIEFVSRYIREHKEDASLTVTKFCSLNRISSGTFGKYIDYVKSYNEPLYSEYIKITKANSAKMINMFVRISRDVLDALNKEGRLKMPLYRYYQITNLDMKIIYNTLQKSTDVFTEKDAGLFRAYWEKYRDPIKISKEWIYNDKIIIGGKEVSKEDKDNVVRYMASHNLPFYVLVYKDILRLYMKGELK